MWPPRRCKAKGPTAEDRLSLLSALGLFLTLEAGGLRSLRCAPLLLLLLLMKPVPESVAGKWERRGGSRGVDSGSSPTCVQLMGRDEGKIG